jgi:hypothetical protein
MQKVNQCSHMRKRFIYTAKVRVSTEFRQHGIPYIFVTSVYSVCHRELPKIPRNYAELYGIPCHGMRPNSAEFRGILLCTEFRMIG